MIFAVGIAKIYLRLTKLKNSAKALFFLRFVPGAGLETYSFSTGCQYFCSRAHKILGNLFKSRRTVSQTVLHRTVENRQTAAFFVPGAGLEPARH